MASRFDRSAVAGLSQVTAAFKKLPEVAKLRLGEATEKTAFALLQRARAHVGVRTGNLKAKLNVSFSKTTGVAKVGIEPGSVGIAGTGGSALTANGARVEVPSKIGHLDEFGHAGPHPAGPHPFMIPAAEAERGAFLDRCRDAGKAIERDLSSGGGLL